MAKYTSLLFACGLGVAACSGASTQFEAQAQSPAQARATPAATPVTPAASVPPVPTIREEAHRLVIATVACWLGGVWSDAEGVDEATRATDAERRCHELIQRVYGTNDQARYERLRAVEPVEVSELKAKILAAASIDSVDHAREQQLGAFLETVANAERETMLGRRAGDRVKKDVEGSREPGHLTTDELAAVAPLNDATAFEALLRLDMGELTPEARAIAILCAVDRMETARGLTKHLKIYTLARPFGVLFGTPTPLVPTDARQPLVPGTWLAYLTAVAGAAGHPVASAAKSPADRELLAWGGALDGLADKLRLEAQQMSDATELKRVAEVVSHRLDAEYRASEAAVLHQTKKG